MSLMLQFTTIMKIYGKSYREYNNKYLEQKLPDLMPGRVLRCPNAEYFFGMLNYFLFCHTVFEFWMRPALVTINDQLI